MDVMKMDTDRKIVRVWEGSADPLQASNLLKLLLLV